MRKDFASIITGLGIDLLLGVLNQLGVPIPDPWLYVGLGLGVLFIVAGIVGMIWPKRKNQRWTFPLHQHL